MWQVFKWWASEVWYAKGSAWRQPDKLTMGELSQLRDAARTSGAAGVSEAGGPLAALLEAMAHFQWKWAAWHSFADSKYRTLDLLVGSPALLKRFAARPWQQGQLESLPLNFPVFRG